MGWERPARILAWACFCLMWIPLGMVIGYDSTGGTSAAFDDILMYAFLALLFLFIFLLSASVFGPLLLGMRESDEVRKNGTLVPAKVLKVSDTGIFVNEQPVLEIVLQVRPPYENRFEATIREIIPFSSIPQIQPGSRLEVYYLPGTTRVALPG